MLYTFSAAPASDKHSSKRKAKRAKVTRACNYCRDHRSRCDAEPPCSRCVANNVKCVLSSPTRRPREGVKPQSNDTLVGQATTASLADFTSTILPTQPPAKATVAKRVDPCSLSSAAEGMDSTVGFLSKINDFCSGISQLSSDSLDDAPPPYPSRDNHLLVASNAAPSPTLLSKPRTMLLLDLYWVRFHRLAPILSRHQVDAICQTLWAPDGSEVQSAALTDGIIALSLRHLGSSGLNRRLLGQHHEQGDLSLAYFQRCLRATSQYAAFAEPSLDHVQCYVLMTLYLRDAGQHQPAYNMIGLALRMAHGLNLHKGLQASGPDTAVAQRLWWTIVYLDFRCARLLGHPVGVRLAEVTCPLPNPDDFSYHARTVSLTNVILTVTEAISQHRSCTDEDRIIQIESRASALSAELYRMQQWREKHLAPVIKRPLHIDDPETHDWALTAANTSPSELLLGILLELHYYDEFIGLHRPFICFPKGTLNAQRSPQADAHATSALKHAMATVDLTHRLMSITDMVHGCSEAYHWQWNALLTLVGFIMAHPLCHYTPTARRHVQLALEIFTSADPSNTVAVRAAALARSLCAKVDNLLQMLQGSSNGDGGDPSATIDPSQLNGDTLWSWTDGSNPDLWSAYSDEVSGVLADISHLPFGTDGFFNSP